MSNEKERIAYKRILALAKAFHEPRKISEETWMRLYKEINEFAEMIGVEKSSTTPEVIIIQRKRFIFRRSLGVSRSLGGCTKRVAPALEVTL